MLKLTLVPCKLQKEVLNGLITNDKFCLSRTGRLTLNWWSVIGLVDTPLRS
jgi:hypothetical protein